MTKISIYIFIIFLLSSCGLRTGAPTSNKSVDTISVVRTPEPNKVQYFKNVVEVGQKVFKENCSSCHCGPGAIVEPPYTCKLRYAFDGLPFDSIPHFVAFIKNSSTTSKGWRINPNITDESKQISYTHEFSKTLSDSLVKTVIEYLWIGYRRVK